MDIILNKKITLKEKKGFIFRDKSYDWDVNYVKMIKDYIKADFSYDKDNRHNLIDGQPLNDIIFDDIYKMFLKSKLGLENKNNILAAISQLCKENSFSIKHEKMIERQAKREEAKEEAKKAKEEAKKAKEEAKKAKEEEAKKAKEEAKKAKEEAKKALPDKLLNYIEEEYSRDLSYNLNNDKIYYKDKIISKQDTELIFLKIKDNKDFENVKKPLFKVILCEVAKLKKFKDNIILNEEVDDTWNILRNVDPDHWQDFLMKDKDGELKHNIFNYSLFLSYHPQFKGNISYNLFDKIESLKKYDREYKKEVNIPIDDSLVKIIESQIEQFFGKINKQYVENALCVVLNNNSFHEIKRKFREFEDKGWDGKPRMQEIMIKYFGCKDCKEIREMTEVMLCGSVQRILEETPDTGTMFDYMGIQFGSQGTGKTKFMTRLYLGDKYISVNPDITDDQKFTDLANRAWLVLFDEMKSIDKADMGTVKSRITEQGANVRLSYGRRSKYYPRHIVFWGNTNYKGVLRDEGYERRFLCFECNTDIKKSAKWWEKNFTDYDIEQIWAETLKIYHEKYENKVIQISQETEEWNYKIQAKHKVWVEDSRTEVDIKEILNYKGYSYPIYEPSQFRIWMKLLDGLKVGTIYNDRYKLKCVKCSWMNYRIPRRVDWITGIVEQLGWKRIYVDDPIFGKEYYYIRDSLTFEDVKKEWETYSNSSVEAQESNKFLPF